MRLPRFNNQLLMAGLDDCVTGHKEAKRALIVMLNRAKIRCFQKYEKLMSPEFLLNPLKILLIGASGTGKTHLINSLSSLCLIPIIKIDATDLNPTGASGGIKTDKLHKMIEDEARKYAEHYSHQYPYLEYAIDQTIVYIDEIDKLGTSFESSGNWNKHVQSNFLTTFDNKDHLSGVSYVFSGAFDSITRKQIAKNNIGFSHHNEPSSKELLDNKILSSGLIPELIGRMNAVIQLDEFSKNDFVSIIHERILPKKKLDLAAYNVFDIELTEEQIEEIAEKCIRSNQGVRFAQREVDRIFLEKEYDAGCGDLDLYLEYMEE